MNKIEIARRCPSCGASIRVQAFFCPQCGIQLEGSISGDQSESTGPPSQPRSWADRSEYHLESPTLMLDEAAPKVQRYPPPQPGPQPRTDTSPKPDLSPTQPLEKLRQVSGDVLEDASHDPSLRFLLVAAVLFIVSFILLILSKLIG